MCVYGVCVYAVRCMSHGGRSRTSAPQGLPAPRTASRRRPDPAPRTASGRAARPRAPHGPARPRDAPLKRGEIMVFFEFAFCVLCATRACRSSSILVDPGRSWPTQVDRGRACSQTGNRNHSGSHEILDARVAESSLFLLVGREGIGGLAPSKRPGRVPRPPTLVAPRGRQGSS